MGGKRKIETAPKKQAGRKKTWQRVIVIGIAAKEGWDELTPGQYLHLKDQVKQLVGFGRQDYQSNLTIAPFGDYWELKAKGGVLGRKNMRVYFKFDKKANDVVVLCTYKKEDDGQAPAFIHIRLKTRWKLYMADYYKNNRILYTRP